MHHRSNWIWLLLALLTITSAQHTRSTYAVTAARSAANRPSVALWVGTAPQHAFVQSNGRTLLDQTGVHWQTPQISPDGTTVAIAVIPTGSETAGLAQLYLFDLASGQRLALLAGHTPHWVENTLIYQTNNATAAYNPTTNQLTFTKSVTTEQIGFLTLPLAPHPSSPPTIRVQHHASNGCRDLPAGQVDVISLEEYVARVVPAEMPAFWMLDALAAQAVAARTYAWRQILVERPDYDVTDWANFQVMCDGRYPSSDLATTMTAGQYLSAVDDANAAPISAMYSAENGHPTLTNRNVNYLQAVPDLFALGKSRFGHGYGLSQWGAQRRALAGHSYRQILGHYYTNVHLQDAQNPQQALGGLHTPMPGEWWSSGALRWSALTAATANTVTLALTASSALTAPLVLDGATGIWRAPQPFAQNTLVTATLLVDGVAQDQVALSVDMQPSPPPTVTISAQADTAFSLTVSAEAAAQVSLRDNWLWPGEILSHTLGSGRIISDAAALGGMAWAGQAGVDQAGVWYGPYTTVLPAPRSYRALFWLRVTAPLTTTTLVRPLARLDVTDDDGETILGLRDLWLSDVITTAHYQPIAVDFHLFAPVKGVEFRVAWRGEVDLALDEVAVWTLPSPVSPTEPLAWNWAGGEWPPRLHLAAFDPAGNLSQPITLTLPITDNAPPFLALTQTAFPTATVRVTWLAQDDRSGVAQVELQQKLGEADWQPHSQSPFLTDSGALNFIVNDEAKVSVRLRAIDRAGQTGPWVEVELQPAAHWSYLSVIQKQ